MDGSVDPQLSAVNFQFLLSGFFVNFTILTKSLINS